MRQGTMTEKQQENRPGRLSFYREFWDFLRIRKKFWLLPIIILLLLLGALIVFTESTALSPLIYILF